MAPNIYDGRLRAREHPVWWDLKGAHTFQGKLSAVEATQLAQMDYIVEKRPTGFHQSVMTTNGFEDQWIVEPGKYKLVRQPSYNDPTIASFGVEVGENYEVMQNAEIAELLDTLTTNWPVETVGALGKGEIAVWCLLMGEGYVRGDPMRNYFTITDYKAKGSFRLTVTPVRYECQNTLELGVMQALITSSMRHTKGMKEDLEWRTNVLKEIDLTTENIYQKLDLIAQFVINDEDAVGKLLEKVFELPKEPARVATARQVEEFKINAPASATIADRLSKARYQYDRKRDIALQARENVKLRYERLNDEFPRLAKTGWMLYNAIVEEVDYADMRTPAIVADNALFGPGVGIKREAFETILSLV